MNEHAYTRVNHGIEPDTQIVVTASGMTVEKTAELYQEDVAKIVFTVRSDADEARQLTIVDEIPAGISTSSVGFHPDYRPECWTMSDDRSVAFESVVEPGEAFETLYGVRIDSPDELVQFRTEPTVTVSPDVAEESLDDGTQPEPSPTADGDKRTDDGHRANSKGGTTGPHAPAIERMQADLDRLRTDVDRLEEIVESTAEELVDVRSRTERFPELAATVDTQVDELDTLRRSLQSTTADHENRIQRLIGQLDDRDTAIKRSMESVEQELHELREEVEQERSWRQNLRGALGVEPKPFDFA